MLIPWASQQRGGVPAPPDPVAISDFANDTYSIGGVVKTYADLWGALPAGLVLDGNGLGITAAASTTAFAQSDLFDAIDPQVGCTAVMSVDLVSPDFTVDHVSITFQIQNPPSSTDIDSVVATVPWVPYFNGSNLFSTPPNQTVSDDNIAGGHIIATSFSSVGLKMSQDGADIIECPASTNYPTLASASLFFIRAAAARAYLKSITFYPLVTDSNVLKALST